MKDSYSDEIMLCFVQGFNGTDRTNTTSRDYEKYQASDGFLRSKKKQAKQVSLKVTNEGIDEIDLKSDNESGELKPLRLSSSDKFLKKLPEVKRSFSDRFSVIGDVTGKRQSRGFLTIRKTRSTGNFTSGQGGCGSPRSAPATPLQLEPHPRTKHDKNASRSLSGSTPSVQVSGPEAVPVKDANEGKAPSKARQKKFLRHFPQVGPDERVLNYYSCALVGDILLQGNLYITKNYFAFYSNVFGYVTKLLIPITSVVRVTKEKLARIIPNAVAVSTRDERHVFGSLYSRDSTYKFMMLVLKNARAPDPPPQDLPISEVDLDASEYSPEDESSSGGGDGVKRRDSDANAVNDHNLPAHPLVPGVSAVLQPALLTGAPPPSPPSPLRPRALLLCLTLLLAFSALVMAQKLYARTLHNSMPIEGDALYGELTGWRVKLHARAAHELHTFLNTNLVLLAKVRQSLEALSSVLLTDLAHNSQHIDVPPNDTAFS